jgi:hypothetical protein
MSENKFGKLGSEMLTEDIITCRKIVKEIGDFGISQKQMVTLIKLLALELEDQVLSRRIYELVNNSKENLSLLHD